MLNILRICHECINNIIKHANATVLRLLVYSDANSLRIEIADNGKGFNFSKIPEGHYGLQNMKHRAGELKAKLEIFSNEGKGTLITISK
jgi:signal transduction histidine kinase